MENLNYSNQCSGEETMTNEDDDVKTEFLIKTHLVTLEIIPIWLTKYTISFDKLSTWCVYVSWWRRGATSRWRVGEKY